MIATKMFDMIIDSETQVAIILMELEAALAKSVASYIASRHNKKGGRAIEIILSRFSVCDLADKDDGYPGRLVATTRLFNNLSFRTSFYLLVDYHVTLSDAQVVTHGQDAYCVVDGCSKDAFILHVEWDGALTVIKVVSSCEWDKM